ncbi:hypothetical protein Tco_1398797 [Tanacetum coccineum]
MVERDVDSLDQVLFLHLALRFCRAVENGSAVGCEIDSSLQPLYLNVRREYVPSLRLELACLTKVSGGHELFFDPIVLDLLMDVLFEGWMPIRFFELFEAKTRLQLYTKVDEENLTDHGNGITNSSDGVRRP